MSKLQKIYALVSEPRIVTGESSIIRCMTTNPRLAILAARVCANGDTFKKFRCIYVVIGSNGEPLHKYSSYKAPYRIFRTTRDSEEREWIEKFEGKFSRYDPFKPCTRKEFAARKNKFRVVIEEQGQFHRFSQDVSLQWALVISRYLPSLKTYNDRGEEIDLLTGKKRQMAA